MMPTLPPPPEAQSLAKYVEREWDRIIKQWQRGWPSETSIASLEDLIRQRGGAIAANSLSAGFDWQTDYDIAMIIHRSKIDFVTWRRSFNDALADQWQAWARDSTKYSTDISLEGLRSMILIHGAAVIAALGVISGQVGQSNYQLVWAAKAMVTFSLLGLFSTAIGFMIIFAYGSEAAARVRWKVVRPMRHKRLYAMSRYLRIYFGRKAKIGDYFAYASIFLFIIGAAITLIILLGA